MDYNNGRSYDSGNGNYSYRGKPPEYGYSDQYKGFFSKSENKEILKISASFGFGLILHVVLQNIYSLVLTSNSELYALYTDNESFSLIAEMLYSLICVGIPFLIAYCILLNLKITNKIIPFCKPQNAAEVFFLVVGGVGLCMASNILTSYIVSYADSVGIGFRSYDTISQISDNAPDSIPLILLTLLHTAIIPAFIEEIAVRGCIMQPLRKFGDLFAILSSAFIFGILHGNLTQAPFAFVAGCILGFVCVYTGSMWPNIIIHLLNNAISVLQSVAISDTDTKGTYIVSAIIIYGLILIGCIALYGFSSTKKTKIKLYKPSFLHYKNKTALFFLCPPTAIALIYFAIELFADIYMK